NAQGGEQRDFSAGDSFGGEEREEEQRELRDEAEHAPVGAAERERLILREQRRGRERESLQSEKNANAAAVRGGHVGAKPAEAERNEERSKGSDDQQSNHFRCDI